MKNVHITEGVLCPLAAGFVADFLNGTAKQKKGDLMFEYKYLEDDDMQSLLDRVGLPDADGKRHFDDWEPIFPIMQIPIGAGLVTFRIVLRRRRIH